MNETIENICYKKNYLADVVARVDFIDSAKSLSEKILPNKIHESIKQRYSIYEPNTATIQGIAISNNSVSTQKEEMQQWIYHGSEREKTIHLNRKNIIVSMKNYTHYDQFKLDVINPIQAIQEIEGNAYVARTGLRFINIFSGVISKIDEANEYFSPMLSGQLNKVFDVENCSRSFLITEYLYENIKVRLQTGIYNPDYPARIKKLDFIVDIDTYIDTPHLFSDVGKIIDELHKQAQHHFEASITNKLRAIMDEQ